MILSKVLATISILIVTILTFTSCNVEVAKESKKQFVTIYTDCLIEKDLSIFQNFQKKNHIIVRIVNLSANDIISKIKAEGYNTNADLIILKSIVSIRKAQRLNLLNFINSEILNELIESNFKSIDNTWFGIGVDPYVLVTKLKAEKEPEKYAELFTNEYQDKWTTDLEEYSDLIPFLGSINRLNKRPEFYKIATHFKEDQLYLGKSMENYLKPNYFLTNFSNYVQNISNQDSLSEIYKPVFLNQTSSGAYFNLHCAGVVKQAKNFDNAKLLLEYLAKNEFNEQLNQKWKTIPISVHQRIHPFEYQNIEFIYYKGSMAKQSLNYSFYQKVIVKMKNEKSLEIYSEPIIPIAIPDSISIQENITPQIVE
jgi:iron(III) transport system substrate-binding protein